MQILSAEQIRAWDNYTILHEPIASIDLMERAAQRCFNWITERYPMPQTFAIFCGKGNNGGDGLALARQLFTAGYGIEVFIIETGKPGSENFQHNLERLRSLPAAIIHFLQHNTDLPGIEKTTVVIDALFGSGLTRSIDGLAKNTVEHLNNTGSTIISIDVPSGLFLDRSSLNSVVVRATYTLTFQCYKLALLLQENAPYTGIVQVLDIGLLPAFFDQVKTTEFFVDELQIKSIIKPRGRFAHKGTYGHALLVAGSYGKMGAAVLATKACLQTGAGLTTVFIPACGYTIMQLSAPEAMVLTDENEKLLATLPPDLEKFSTIGIGPGIGTAQPTQNLLSYIIRRFAKPFVLDADALNCLAMDSALLNQLPPYSIITPHPKEFDRLFGAQENDFERLATARKKAAELSVIIVLKSHHTAVVLPDGEVYFNSTGNAGMAKGGSGDVLTGVITALLAQGYLPQDAAVLGVYLHGWAGDFAASKYSKEAMLPSHTIASLSDVFLALQS